MDMTLPPHLRPFDSFEALRLSNLARAQALPKEYPNLSFDLQARELLYLSHLVDREIGRIATHGVHPTHVAHEVAKIVIAADRLSTSLGWPLAKAVERQFDEESRATGWPKIIKTALIQ